MLRIYLLFFLIVVVGCREDLVHLGSELDANRVLFALRDKGIEATKSSIGKEWVVKIATSDLTNALRVLEEKKIFQDAAEATTEVSSNVFQSKEEKKDIRDKDLSRSLSSSMRLIPLVKEARVHIYNTFNDPLDLDPKNERSASVLIVHDSGVVSEDVIKELVSRGAGLTKDKVSVLFIVSRVARDALKDDKQIQAPVINSPGETDLELNSTFLAQLLNLNKLKNSHYFVGVFILGAICLVCLSRKLKLRKRSISRTEILDKLNEERLRNESM